jgi:hypothetical protein
MTDATPFSDYDPAALPAVIAGYLEASADAGRRQSLLASFAPDASVTDEGIRHEGRSAIEGWLSTAASEYTYTTTLLGQRRDDPERWVVLARLDGNFPGGVAELKYRFRIRGGEIADLVIAP